MRVQSSCSFTREMLKKTIWLCDNLCRLKLGPRPSSVAGTLQQLFAPSRSHCRRVFNQRAGGAVSCLLLAAPPQKLTALAVTRTVPSLTSLPHSMSFFQLPHKKHDNDEQHENQNSHQAWQQEILLLLDAFGYQILLCKRGRCMFVLLNSFLGVCGN